MKTALNFTKTLLIALILSVGVSYLFAAWTPPPSNPPNSNTDAPINVGGISQTKIGDICTTFGGSQKCLSQAGAGVFNLSNETIAQASSGGTSNISLGSGWEACFLTRNYPMGSSGNAILRCWVSGSAGGDWTLTAQAGANDTIQCGARCIDLR